MKTYRHRSSARKKVVAYIVGLIDILDKKKKQTKKTNWSVVGVVMSMSCCSCIVDYL